MNVSVMCFKLIKCLSVQSFDNKILNRLNRIEYWNDLLKNCQGIKLLSSCNSYSTGQKSSNYSKSTEQNRQLTFKPHAKTGHRQTKKKKKKTPTQHSLKSPHPEQSGTKKLNAPNIPLSTVQFRGQKTTNKQPIPEPNLHHRTGGGAHNDRRRDVGGRPRAAHAERVVAWGCTYGRSLRVRRVRVCTVRPVRDAATED